MPSGNKVASPESVAAYLQEEYEVDETKVLQLVEKHTESIMADRDMGSFAYWIGDKIADAEKLTPREAPDTMSDEVNHVED